MLKEYYYDVVDWNVYSTKNDELITTIHNCPTLKNLSDDKAEKLLKNVAFLIQILVIFISKQLTIVFLLLEFLLLKIIKNIIV